MLICGRALQAILNIVTLRVMTTFLSPSEAGKVFLVIAYSAGFSVFLITPVGTYVARRIHSWQLRKSVISRLTSFAVYIFMVSALAFLLVPLLRALSGATGAGQTWGFAAITAVYILFSSYCMTFIPAFNMLGFQKEFTGYTLALAVLALSFSSFAALKLSPDSQAWLYGQIAAMSLLSLAAYFKLKAKLAEALLTPARLVESLRGADFKPMASFAVPLAAATFFMWVQTQGYRVIVELRSGTEFLGYLAIGLGIAASLAAVVETLVQQTFVPVFYRKISAADSQGRKKAFMELVSRAVPAYSILLVFTVSLASSLTRVLVAPQYYSVAKFVMLGAFIEYFRLLSGLVSAAAHSELRTSSLISPYAAGGAVVLAGVYVFGPVPLRDILVPSAMLLGGALTFFVLKFRTARELSFGIDLSVFAKPVAYSAPFLLFLLSGDAGGAGLPFLLLLLGGLYFVFVQYHLVFKGANAHSITPAKEAELR